MRNKAQKEKKKEMQKNVEGKEKKINYEDFPLSLAIFDAVPVLLFSAAVVLIGVRFQNTWFRIGSVLCALGGTGKVIWKIIIAATRKDIVWMNRQMRVLMPLGFAGMIVGLITGIRSGIVCWSGIKGMVCTLPAGGFFAVTVLGMICMGVFAGKLDSTKVRSNWIEQITNAVAQGCFLLGVLSCILK